MQVVIAVKHKFRDEVPVDWNDLIGRVEGAAILAASAHRVTASLTPEAFASISKLLGNYCHIETVTDRIPY